MIGIAIREKEKEEGKRKRERGGRAGKKGEVCDIYVMIARRTKLVPPAKSVSLSNLREKAMEKKKS